MATRPIQKNKVAALEKLASGKLEKQPLTETLYLTSKELESLNKIVTVYERTSDDWIKSLILEALNEMVRDTQSWNVNHWLITVFEAKTKIPLRDIEGEQLKSKLQVTITLNENQARIFESLAACLNNTKRFFIYDIVATRVRALMYARINDDYLSEHFTIQEALNIYQSWGGNEKCVLKEAGEKMAAQSS